MRGCGPRDSARRGAWPSAISVGPGQYLPRWPAGNFIYSHRRGSLRPSPRKTRAFIFTFTFHFDQTAARPAVRTRSRYENVNDRVGSRRGNDRTVTQGLGPFCTEKKTGENMQNLPIWVTAILVAKTDRIEL